MRLKFIKEFSFLTKATIRKLKLSKLYTTYLKIDKLNIHIMVREVRLLKMPWA